jgi:opacity protein-like surface antigen
MYRTSLISLTAIVIAATAAINVNAQDITPKKYSVGPAIEFSGSGTSFGIQGKVNVIPNFSVRPMALFGYPTNLSIPVNSPGATAPITYPGFSYPIVIDTPVSGPTTTQLVPSGTAYGLAITYDLAFSDSKLSGYVGPRILFVSASGRIGSVNINANQTNIGLLAGVDYKISDQLTAGLSAIYDFSRSGSFTATGSTTANSNGTTSYSGSGFNVGVNLGYSF